MSDTFESTSSKSVIRPVYFVYLDIKDDPLWFWTGTYDLDTGSGNEDPALDDVEFLATGAMAEIGPIEDSNRGGSPLTLTFPAPDPALPMFKQIIADARAWQWRRAIVWHSYVDEDGVLLYEPRRRRTGRMDNLKLVHPEDDTRISVDIEGHAAHASRALETRWVEQRELDPNDSSQDWVHDLANKQPTLGQGDQARGNIGGIGGGSLRDDDPFTRDRRIV